MNLASGKTRVVETAVETVKTGWRTTQDLFRSSRSVDRPTRWMARFFIISCSAALVTMVWGWIYLRQTYGTHPLFESDKSQAQNLSKLIEKKKAEVNAFHTSFRLGTFAVAMKDIPGSKPLPGVVNMAEIEIYLECESKEACEYLEHNQVQARDSVTAVLTPLDRDEILKPRGKQRLRQAIAEKLNSFLPQGKTIRQVYFSRLLID